MNKKASSSCAICECSNRSSICAICVNYRLNECHNLLKSLKSRRDHLYSKLSEVLVAKADGQMTWRVIRDDEVATLKEKLRRSEEQLDKGRAEIETTSYDLKVKYGVLESAHNVLQKNRVEQLEKFYPNLIYTHSLGHMAITSELLHKQSLVIKQICKLFPQCLVSIDGERKDGSTGQYDQICNGRLPRGLDPHSIPPEELAASLGYMVQNLNLVVRNLAAPALHNTGFAKNLRDYNLPTSAASFLYGTEISDVGKNENLADGWDLVEHPTYPPPPSQTEDVEHWTRAMFTDATKK